MTRNDTAAREYDAAVISLTHAEELAGLFEGADFANPYIADAAERANQLVAEMNDNLDDVMARWSPAECFGIDA